MIDKLTDHLFELPGSILIRTPNKSSTLGIELEFGIQNQKQSKRFANVFGPKGDEFIYFKHNVESVEELYRSYPNAIVCSDVSPKYWSRARLNGDVPFELLRSLLNDSYGYVRESYPKKIKAVLDEFSNEPNMFKVFYNACVRLAESKDFSYQYSDGFEPRILCSGKPIAYFLYNQLCLMVARSFEFQQINGLKVIEESGDFKRMLLSSQNPNEWDTAILSCAQSFT